jgi:hypothetical protein
MLPHMRRIPTPPLGVLLGTLLLLTACSGAPVAPAYTQEELEARCLRTGGQWIDSRSYSQVSGHCEYRR